MPDTATPAAALDEILNKVPRLHWGRVRFIGNLRTLVVGYMLAVAIALPDLVGTDLRRYLKDPPFIWLLVASAFGLGLAFLIYELSCPAVVRRFEKLADFYETQLRIKKLQIDTYPSDPFEASLLHCAKHYVDSLQRHRAAMYLSILSYSVGFLALFLLVIRLYHIL
jgi:hypothetical protein